MSERLRAVEVYIVVAIGLLAWTSAGMPGAGLVRDIAADSELNDLAPWVSSHSESEPGSLTVSPDTGTTYSVTFTEVGLIPGTSWTVTLSGVPASSTEPWVSFSEASGSYAYAIASAGGGASPTPSSGTVTVSSSAVYVNVAFVSIESVTGATSSSESSWASTLSFSVGSEATSEIYIWAIGASGGTYQNPTLPAGLGINASSVIQTSSMSLGMAYGTLAPGSYSVSDEYTGTINTALVAVYEVFGGLGFQYQFVAVPQATTLLASSSAVALLAVAGTGGLNGITSSTISPVQYSVESSYGTGLSEEVGPSTSNPISITPSSATAAYGISGLALSTPVFQFLGGYSDTPYSSGWSDDLEFSVPSGDTEVLFIWSLGGTGASFSAPVLPGGLSVQPLSLVSSTDMTAGIASGTLPTGLNSISMSYAGATDAVSLAVFGIVGGSGLSYQFNAVAQGTSTSLPSGGFVYLGAEGTGGYWPLAANSLGKVYADASSVAETGSPAELIGVQWTDTFSFSQGSAGTYGATEVGVYYSATSPACDATNCVTLQEYAPYATGFYTQDVVDDGGSGWNSYLSGPVDNYEDGQVEVEQQSGATYEGAYEEYTFLTLEGETFTLPANEFAQFEFQMSASWAYSWDVDCIVGSVTGAVAGEWLAGILDYTQYTHSSQLFAFDTSAPCTAFEPAGRSADSVTPDQSGSGSAETTIAFGEFLAAGTYTPVIELLVVTDASTVGISTITSTVNMAGSEGGIWGSMSVLYSNPVGGCLVSQGDITPSGTCTVNTWFSPGQTMELTVAAPTSSDPIGVVAFVNGVEGTPSVWSTSSDGWTYTMSVGAAPDSDGAVVPIYAEVAFSNGTTAYTNTCYAVIT